MNLVVLPQAADEFEDAAAHYADKQPGLGQRFRDEVDRQALGDSGQWQGWLRAHLPGIPRLIAPAYFNAHPPSPPPS
jgi:hypothetical protein